MNMKVHGQRRGFCAAPPLASASAIVILGLTLAACGADLSPEPGSRLRQSFPEQASEVIGTRTAFVDRGPTFALVDEARALGNIDAELPKQGEGVIRLALPDVEVRVREVGARGAARTVGTAVAYERAGGTSYWTTAPAGGVEEWLHFDAGVITRGAVAAAWEVEGLAPQAAGAVVELLDGTGLPRVRVSAPAAYAAGGRPLAARLGVRGRTIELFVDAAGEEVLVDPAWVAAASLNVGRRLHVSTLLADGRVLVTGGLASGAYITGAEIYDPTTNAWTVTGGLLDTRGRHTATLLPDGKVLIVGGYAGIFNYRADAEIYDPATGVSTTAATLNARISHSATILTDGRVLIAGGFGTSAPNLQTIIYDHTAGTFTTVAALPQEHHSHSATRLADGRVMLASSYSSSNNPTVLAGNHIYDPTTNTWTTAASMLAAQYNHVSGLLPDGRVIVAGGDGFSFPVKTVEIYDPTTNSWSFAASMSIERTRAMGGVLTDGTLLVAGGYSGFNYLATTEIYSPTTNTWASAGSLSLARYGAGYERLNTGEALVIGGDGYLNGYASAVDKYTGFAANGAACAVGSQCLTGFCVDGVCCSSACGGGSTTDCQACSAAAGAATNGTCATLTTGSCAPADTCITIQRGTSGTVNEAHVNSSGAGTNYGANATLSTGSSGAGNTRYGLLRFDLSSIPSTATITTATLTLTVFSGGGVDVRAHRITSSWSESTVTYTNFGSAFDSTVELTMNGSTTYTGSLASLVQSWVNGTYSNYGVALERDLTATTIFDASEWATTADRPKLYVCYH